MELIWVVLSLLGLVAMAAGSVAPVGGGIDPIQQDIDLLNQEDEGEDKKGEKKEEPKPEDEEPKPEGDEEPEKEEEKEPKPEEEPTDELEPTYKALKAAYPDIFKKFPDLKEVFFRERAYTEVFPTVEEATEAAETAEQYTTLRDSVIGGELGLLTDALHESGSLDRFALSVLPALFEKSKDAYYAATTPIFESLLRNAFNEGRTKGDKNLQFGAEHLSQFLFGTPDIARGLKTFTRQAEREPSPEQQEFENEKRQFYNERYNTARTEVLDTADVRLRQSIVQGLDPDGVFTQGMQKMLVKEIQEEVDRRLAADPRHMAVMNALWKKGARSGFTAALKGQIINTFLTRAKSIVPAVRDKVRAEALGSKQKDGERRANNGAKREPEAGVPSGKVPAKIDASKIDWRKTSDVDLLEGRATLRK